MLLTLPSPPSCCFLVVSAARRPVFFRSNCRFIAREPHPPASMPSPGLLLPRSGPWHAEHAACDPTNTQLLILLCSPCCSHAAAQFLADSHPCLYQAHPTLSPSLVSVPHPGILFLHHLRTFDIVPCPNARTTLGAFESAQGHTSTFRAPLHS